MTKTAAAEPVAWVLRGGLKNLASGSHDWVQIYNDKTKDGDMVPLYTVPLNAAPGYCPHCKQYTIEEPLPAPPAFDAEEAKDAARYRWLKRRHAIPAMPDDDGTLCIYFLCDFENYNDVDAAIDAAMKESL